MIKKLFEIAGKRKKNLIKGTVLKVIESLFAGAPFGFLYLILNELFLKSINMRKIALMIIGLGACFLLQAVFYYWSDVVNNSAGLRILSDLRIRLGERIRTLSMGFYSERQTGDLNTIINQDVKSIEPVPTVFYPKLVAAIALPGFIAVFLFFIDWRMALATISVIPFALIVLNATQRPFKRLAGLRAEASAQANSKIIEYIQGIGAIKAFNQVGERFKKFEEAMQDYKKANVELVLNLPCPFPLFRRSWDWALVLS